MASRSLELLLEAARAHEKAPPVATFIEGFLVGMKFSTDAIPPVRDALLISLKTMLQETDPELGPLMWAFERSPAYKLLLDTADADCYNSSKEEERADSTS